MLPTPPGLTIADAMSYGTIDLGLIGTAVNSVMNAGLTPDAGKLLSSAKNGISGIKSQISQNAVSSNAAAALAIALKDMPVLSSLGGEETGNMVNFGARQVLSPNSNTTFQNSTIRGFSFTFKLAAKSAADSQIIKSIVDTFRLNMYPEGNDFIMHYPSTWQIAFKDGSSDSKFLPGLYESYLTSLTTTYNGGSNIFFDDGAPLEVDIAVAFQEARALRKSDIQRLGPGIAPYNGEQGTSDAFFTANGK